MGGRYDVPVPGVRGYGKHLRPEHCRAVMEPDGEPVTAALPNGTRETTRRWDCQVCDAALAVVLVEPVLYTAG